MAEDREEISITDEGDHLRVTVSGSFSVPKALAWMKAVERAASSRRPGALLVDVRAMGGPESILDRYTVAKAAAQTMPARIRTALLTNEILPDKFFETAAVNRGLQLRVFSDPADALRWLREPPPSR